MCLIVFAWRPGHLQPLVLAANRDEFYARPTQPLASWPDAPGVHAGRDLEAGGTWLGLGPEGRFAAVTNIRRPGQPPGKRSRGGLTANFLLDQRSIEAYAQEVLQQADEYAGFNLLLGDARQLYYLSSDSQTLEPLSEGVYGLSNAGLNTPWPKLLKARNELAQRLANESPADLLELLHDTQPAADGELPDTGVGLATERLLSSVFISSANYGTRASTALLVSADGHRQIIERSFGPQGARLGEVSLSL